jgi:membrane protease YdiL (CAAX protease family)
MHTLVDVALVLLYAVVWVVVEIVRLPKARERMSAAPPGARAKEYYSTMLIQWALAGRVLARLAFGHRPAAAIGLALPHGAVGWVVTALALAMVGWLLNQQSRGATGSDRARASMSKALAKIAWMLPREKREFAAFSLLSMTAGVCEEILFRGHLLAFLDSLIGPYVGTAVAVVAFGLAHAYQGRSGIIRTGLVGLFMALVYRATGSLLAPIVAHAWIDWSAGRMIEAAIRRGLDLSVAPASPGAPAPAQELAQA